MTVDQQRYPSPAELLAATNSFVSETAVKLDRLETRTSSLEQTLATTVGAQRSDVSELHVRLKIAEGHLSVIADDIFSVSTKRAADVATFVSVDHFSSTMIELNRAMKEMDKTCGARHNSPEEDYERLRLRIDKIEKNSKPKYDVSWGFGAVMFSVGMICSQLLRSLPL